PSGIKPCTSAASPTTFFTMSTMGATEAATRILPPFPPGPEGDAEHAARTARLKRATIARGLRPDMTTTPGGLLERTDDDAYPIATCNLLQLTRDASAVRSAEPLDTPRRRPRARARSRPPCRGFARRRRVDRS